MSNLHNFIYPINNIHSTTNGNNISNLKVTVINSNTYINIVESLIINALWAWDDTMIWNDTDIWYDTK